MRGAAIDGVRVAARGEGEGDPVGPAGAAGLGDGGTSVVGGDA